MKASPLDSSSQTYLSKNIYTFLFSPFLPKQLPDVHKSQQGLGFFGYIFLLVIIAFSAVGILKTFENDLLNSFPQTEYVFELLNQQLEFFAETVKNMIVIVNDLIGSY